MKQLSLICPTARTKDVCMRMVSSIKTNLDMEIIFVGPVDYFGKEKLYISHKFIVASVMLTQCLQIGMYHAKGETVGIIADDERFSPYAWDESYSIYKSSENYKTIVSLNWWEPAFEKRTKQFIQAGIAIIEEKKDTPKGHRLYNNLKPVIERFGIQLPTGCSVMSRKFFLELGGYDANFVRRLAPQDLFLRAVANGAIIKYCDEGSVFEDLKTKLSKGVTKPAAARKFDEDLYDSKWAFQDGILKQIMESRFFEFSKSIYTVSQSPM